MKKLCLTLIAVCLLFEYSLAQWTNQTGTGNYYLTSGNAGIDTTAPTHSLTFSKSSTGWAQYNFSDGTGANFERLVAQVQSNVYTIGSYFNGSGIPRSITLGIQTIAGTNTLTSGRLFTINSNPAANSGMFNFYESTGESGTIVTFNTSLQGGTAGEQQSMVSIQGAVTQSSSAGFTALLIAPEISGSTGTGNRYLIDAGVNSASGGGGTHTQEFTVDPGGNGYFAGSARIGTSLLPTGYEVAVGGNMIAGSITVQAPSLWPDFVFKKDYRLMPLNKLKAYIEQNNRLPEVPDAQQVAQEGLNLGEMNKVLLKKVEELTLYLMEQQKEIDNLKKKVSNLTKEK